jgi:hypothetical protein
MACSRPNVDLSPIQRDVLREFFAREKGFFLTGGAALTGYHLHHRPTTDLDLFALDDAAFERGPHALADAVASLQSSLEVRQDAPGFRRHAVARGDESVIVDLVRERVPQLHPEKLLRDGVWVDPPDEILANKLTAIVGRAEERDVVDVYFLEQAGLRVEGALDAALAKDGGCTPAQLAWVLSQMTIPDGARLPGGVAPGELRRFLDELIRRFRRAAMPKT